MPENDTVERAYSAIVAKWRLLQLKSRSAFARQLADYSVYFAYNSGRIENESITYHDTREIFESGRAVAFTGDVRTLFEIQNQKECHELVLDALGVGRPLDEAFVLEVHRALTQGTYDERRWSQGERPGSYKLHDYVVGVSEAGSRPADVKRDIEALLDEISVATPENALTVAAYFHAVLESIHPFADGNGRVGRALMNYLLMANNHPPIIIYEDDRLAYYGALQVWDEEDDLAPLLDLLQAETVKTWQRSLLR